MAFRDHCYRSDKKIIEEGIYSVNTLETQATGTSGKSNTQWRRSEEEGAGIAGKLETTPDSVYSTGKDPEYHHH